MKIPAPVTEHDINISCKDITTVCMCYVCMASPLSYSLRNRFIPHFRVILCYCCHICIFIL